MPALRRPVTLAAATATLAVALVATDLPAHAAPSAPAARHAVADLAAPAAIDPDFAGYTARIAGTRSTRTVVEVPSPGTCDATEKGVAALLMQTAGPRFAGVRAFAICRDGAPTFQVDIVTNQRGLKILPASQAGDRLVASIVEQGGLTKITVTNLTRGWEEKENVAAIGAVKYVVGDSLVGRDGAAFPLVDFGTHTFADTKISGAKLAEADKRRDSTSDADGALATTSKIIQQDTFTVTYTAP